MIKVLLIHIPADAARAERLAAALRRHGLEAATQALPSSKAAGVADRVLALWSKDSLGPIGAPLRARAAKAAVAGELISVQLDGASVPDGLADRTADLSAWRGAAGNPAIITLAEMCLDTGSDPATAARVHRRMARLVRRALTGSALAVTLGGAWAATTNVANYQGYLCNIPAGQPTTSDICGALHAGGKPTHDERIAWAARKPGDCQALRLHIARFPHGAHRSEAADLLQAVRVERAANYSPAPRGLRGYVRQSEHPFASQAAARADAHQRALADAVTACAPADANERLAGADVTDGAYDCRPGAGGGAVCALDYAVTCRIETRALVERCG